MVRRGVSSRKERALANVWLMLIGVGLGVAFSAPIGPVNIMCIQQAFQRGFFGGLAAGIGAVFADGVFAALAAYGTTAVGDRIAEWTTAFQATGGLVLVIFGWKIMRARPSLMAQEPTTASLLTTAISSFGLTISNPATILGFVALFGSMGRLAPQPGDFFGATLLVLGVLTGGSGWWVLVASIVSAVRSRMTDRSLARINQGAGGSLMLLGGVILIRLALVA